MKYYKVTVLRGHIGVSHDASTITFYEKAENMLKAIDQARKHGGVKHNKMPVEAKEITETEFFAQKGTNAYEKAGCKNKVFQFFRFLRN